MAGEETAPLTEAEALLQQLRNEERATWGIDPDGTAYLDASERVERVRSAYMAQLAAEDAEPTKPQERGPVGEARITELP